MAVRTKPKPIETTPKKAAPTGDDAPPSPPPPPAKKTTTTDTFTRTTSGGGPDGSGLHGSGIVPVPEPQPDALEIAPTEDPQSRPVGQDGQTLDTLKDNYNAAVRNATNYFIAPTPELPLSQGGQSASFTFDATSGNVDERLAAAGHHFSEIREALNAVDAVGRDKFEFTPADYKNMAEMAAAYKGFMVDNAKEAAEKSLDFTLNVANDTKIEAEANEAHNAARAWSVMGAVAGFASLPSAGVGVATATTGTARDTGILAGAGGAVSAARGAWLDAQMERVATAGDITNPVSQQDLARADELAAQLRGMTDLLASNEGFETALKHVQDANALGSKVIKEASKEAFAVGTLANLRANARLTDDAPSSFDPSDARRFIGEVTIGGETGMLDVFAARDLEALGYKVQIRDEGGPRSLVDAAGNVTYSKVGDANNFFIANIDDGAPGLPRAGISWWDRGLDVTINKQLDRIDDRWSSPGDPKAQAQDVLNTFAHNLGIAL